MSKNLNYLFNKEYFINLHDKEMHQDQVNECNHQLVGFEYINNISDVNVIKKLALFENKTIKIFQLKTHYPGLLLGLGNHHESGNPHEIKQKQNDEIKLGFFFDYVSGLPVIPGSTVKGVLRSPFRQCAEYIEELLNTILEEDINTDFSVTEEEVKILEQSIFGEWCKGENPKDVLPIQGRDVFFDAIVSSAAKPIPNKQGNLMDFEYITSHRADDKSLQGLTEPNPVKLLKVRAGVTFEFSFMLKDVEINKKKITVEHKSELFKKIIENLGIGAKTNTGFGIMIDQ